MLYNDPYKCMFVIIRVYMKLTLPTVLCTNLAQNVRTNVMNERHCYERERSGEDLAYRKNVLNCINNMNSL